MPKVSKGETKGVRDKREKGYRRLLLWQRLREFAKLVYFLIDKLPVSENFGLKPQVRRAVVSIISNFVEGYLKTVPFDTFIFPLVLFSAKIAFVNIASVAQR